MAAAKAARKKRAHKTTTRMLPRLARDPGKEILSNISLPVRASLLFFIVLLIIADIPAGRDKNRPRQRNFLTAFLKGQLNLDPPGNPFLIRPRPLPAGFDLFFPVFDLFAIRIILEHDRLDRSHLLRTNTSFNNRGNYRGKIFFLFYQRLLRAVKTIRSFLKHSKRMAIFSKLRADGREANALTIPFKFNLRKHKSIAHVALKSFQEQ